MSCEDYVLWSSPDDRIELEEREKREKKEIKLEFEGSTVSCWVRLRLYCWLFNCRSFWKEEKGGVCVSCEWKSKKLQEGGPCCESWGTSFTSPFSTSSVISNWPSLWPLKPHLPSPLSWLHQIWPHLSLSNLSHSLSKLFQCCTAQNGFVSPPSFFPPSVFNWPSSLWAMPLFTYRFSFWPLALFEVSAAQRIHHI